MSWSFPGFRPGKTGIWFRTPPRSRARRCQNSPVQTREEASISHFPAPPGVPVYGRRWRRGGTVAAPDPAVPPGALFCRRSLSAIL